MRKKNDFFFLLSLFEGFPLWPLWLGGGCSLGAENTARVESVLLAAARFRCLRERVGTTYTRFHLPDDVESIGVTIWPLREPAPRRQVLAMATQGKCGFQGGASRPDPGERGVPPARGGYPPK